MTRPPPSDLPAWRNACRPAWRDHRDEPTARPDVPRADEPAFYRPIGDLQGDVYRRNAFALGTHEELAALRGMVDLRAGVRLLDVGCGDARHLRVLAGEGVVGTGVDVSLGLVAAGLTAAEAAGVEIELLVGDARELGVVLGRRSGTFDVVWSLCQGALGTSPVTDPAVLDGMAAAVRPGGTVVATLFHALFAARHLAPGDAFDPIDLVHHQVSEVYGPEHRRERFDLWTASYTVRDAERLCAAAGLEVVSVRGVQPGDYGERACGEVGLDDPELLVVARRRD